MDPTLDGPLIAYSISQYLLDRANIHDTITRLSAYSDCKDFERLGNEVFASEVTIDNSHITNDEPQGNAPVTVCFCALPSKMTPNLARTGHEEAEFWAKYSERFTASQHVMTCILVNLPQPAPTWNIAMPHKATASANTIVTYRRDRARGDTVAQHGSYYTFDLVRQPGGEPGMNPWRITRMKAHPFWFKGNSEVMN